MKIILLEPNLEGLILMPSLSIAALESFVNEKTEHEAKVIDLSFQKKNWKDYLKHQIETIKPDLIGISILSFNYAQALKIASFIKKKYNIKTLFGGVHVILMGEETLENKEVDFVCVGEGEYSLKDLLDNNLDAKGVKGVWYKEYGKIIKNENQRLIENLDSLPFPSWESYKLDKYFLVNNNHLPIMVSRGCPYSCTYCSNHALKRKLDGKYVRFRSVDNVIKEIDLRIKQYRKKGLKYLFFYDDTFILYKDFVMEFCKKYKEKGFHKIMKWNVNVRANLVDDEVIKAMKDAGCYEVRMGVESGNDDIRNKLYKRDMGEEEIFNAVKIIKKNKLRFRVQFIVGAPYDNEKSMKESYDMAKKINADYTLFPILMPLPCTEIKEVCEKEHLIEKRKFKDSHEMYTHPVIRTKFVSRKEIQKVVNKVRNYQLKKIINEGIKMRGIIFFWDLMVFLVYYKPKYGLEVDNAFRFTVNKYYLEDLEKKSKIQ